MKWQVALMNLFLHHFFNSRCSKTVGFSNSNEAYKYVKLEAENLMKKCDKADFMELPRKKLAFNN